jgi:hypothetical protein
MSCDQKEYGVFKLPAEEFNPLRKAVIDAFNQRELLRFEFATLVHAEIVAQIKKAKNADVRLSVMYQNAVHRVKNSAPVIKYGGYGFGTERKFDNICNDDIYYSLIRD